MNEALPITYRLNPEHLFSDLKDEAAVLSLTTGKYYGLNPVGVAIWHALEQNATLAELEGAVRREYAVDAETCRREVAAFIESLRAEQLIEVMGAAD